MGPLISHLYEKLDRIRLAILEFCPYIIDIPRLSILAHLFMKLSTNLGLGLGLTVRLQCHGVGVGVRSAVGLGLTVPRQAI